MKQQAQLELQDVKRIAAAAEAHALQNGWAVTIAVVDAGGHLLWPCSRADPARRFAPWRGQSGQRWARRESKAYEDMINQGRVSFLSAPGLQGLLEGGVPILVDGQCVGAVGVSGVKSSEDVEIARAGIAAL